MTLAERQPIDPAILAADYRKSFKGKMSEATIAKVAASIEDRASAGGGNAETPHPANGSIVSLVFWEECKCSIKDGRAFKGHSWGIAVPGAAALWGDVYSDNLDRLYADTTSFTMISAEFYSAFIFHDSQGNYLGAFHAGAFGTVIGEAGGSGSWS